MCVNRLDDKNWYIYLLQIRTGISNHISCFMCDVITHPCSHFNTLRPRQNGHHFPDDSFKRIFLNENVGITINISLKFVPKGPINNILALVQIMAWRRLGDKPLSEPMVLNLLTHICVTRPQWVNGDLSKQTLNWLGSVITPQSLATNSPAPGPRPLTCGVSSECLGTRSYETTSRDQRGKIQMFFSSIGACTATKSLIANHRSSIVAQLYFASVTQMFLMPLFVKVESGSNKLLRTVSKSGPNGCKERSRPQKMLMRIKIESFLGRQNLVLTVTHSHKQPREEQKMIVTWTALIIITKFF